MIKKDFKIGWPQFTLSTRDAAVVIHPTHPSPVWMKQVRMIGFKYCSRQREKKRNEYHHHSRTIKVESLTIW